MSNPLQTRNKMICEVSRKGTFEEQDTCYRAVIEEPLAQVAEFGHADVVVGVPFYNERKGERWQL